MESICNNKEIWKTKAIAIGKICRMYKILKDYEINVIRLKQLIPDGRLPCGVLSNPHYMRKIIDTLEKAREYDELNIDAVPKVHLVDIMHGGTSRLKWNYK